MPSSETNSSSASQEIRFILWDLNVHYYVHNNQPLDPILSQINQIISLLFYFFKIHVNIILLSTPVSSISNFPHENPVYIFLLPIWAACPAHPILHDVIS
jgi:hypothetical protein